MARAWHQSGLLHYLRSSLYDVDVAALRKAHLRPYLEHRLRQIDIWLDYLARYYEQQPPRGWDGALWSHNGAAVKLASDMLDVAYLQAVRQVITETLETL